MLIRNFCRVVNIASVYRGGFLARAYSTSTFTLARHVLPVVTRCQQPCLNSNLQIHRGAKKKASKKSKAQDSDDEDEEQVENQVDQWYEDLLEGTRTKVKTYSVSSMRVDTMVKFLTGSSRSKLDSYFLERRVRINGKKVSKKSVEVNAGDEVDVVIGMNEKNSSNINVRRAEILKAVPSDAKDAILLTIRITKSLAIENYSGADVWSD